jgi:hypothetical protein
VTVIAVIAAMALDHIASLQVSALGAEQETTAAQVRSSAALAEARGAVAAASAAPICPITPAQAAPSGTLPSAEPPPSCP